MGIRSEQNIPSENVAAGSSGSLSILQYIESQKILRFYVLPRHPLVKARAVQADQARAQRGSFSHQTILLPRQGKDARRGRVNCARTVHC